MGFMMQLGFILMRPCSASDFRAFCIISLGFQDRIHVKAAFVLVSQIHDPASSGGVFCIMCCSGIFGFSYHLCCRGSGVWICREFRIWLWEVIELVHEQCLYMNTKCVVSISIKRLLFYCRNRFLFVIYNLFCENGSVFFLHLSWWGELMNEVQQWAIGDASILKRYNFFLYNFESKSVDKNHIKTSTSHVKLPSTTKVKSFGSWPI